MNSAVTVPISGSEVTLNLTSQHSVPASATEVIIYALVVTPWLSETSSGTMVVKAGTFTRNLLVRVAPGAITYNSDYFVIPVTIDRKVTAKLELSPAVTNSFTSEVTVTGYYTAE